MVERSRTDSPSASAATESGPFAFGGDGEREEDGMGICLEIPEVSASRMVERSFGPGDGVRRMG